jgi:hypothetical protein
VIPFGADAAEEPAEPCVPGVFGAMHGVRDFVLCVGRLESRQNQLMLLEALRDDHRPVVLVGGGFSYEPDYARLCAAYRRRGATLLIDQIPGSLLGAARAEAAVHCTPGWYELPGLRRWRRRVWGHGSRPRVSAIADYLTARSPIATDDPESIQRAIRPHAGSIRRRRREGARRFTWERTARGTLALCEIAPAAGVATSAAVTAPGARRRPRHGYRGPRRGRGIVRAAGRARAIRTASCRTLDGGAEGAEHLSIAGCARSR